MRIDGKLVKWNDERGFGFISPIHGGQEIFVHISTFPNDGQRPVLGELLSFEIEIDKAGKKRPKAVSRPVRAKVSRQQTSVHLREKQGLASRLMMLLIVAGLVAYGYGEYFRGNNSSVDTNGTEYKRNESTATVSSQQPTSSDAEFSSAYNNHTSNLQIQGRGKVVTLLPDDNNGSRHQRFILRLNSGQTLLVAHNIDLAPRLDSLNEGDSVTFYGQYEWNEKGGVVHWTHGDPNGFHVAGWIEHNGKKYQ